MFCVYRYSESVRELATANHGHIEYIHLWLLSKNNNYDCQPCTYRIYTPIIIIKKYMIYFHTHTIYYMCMEIYTWYISIHIWYIIRTVVSLVCGCVLTNLCGYYNESDRVDSPIRMLQSIRQRTGGCQLCLNPKTIPPRTKLCGRQNSPTLKRQLYTHDKRHDSR